MDALQAVYAALAIFGTGVTIIDLLGFLEHAGGHGAHDGDQVADAAHDDGTAHHGAESENQQTLASARGSLLVSGEARTLAVARIIGILRNLVYFSLGAGATGSFALFLGLGGPASLAWSAGTGIFVAVLARFVRRATRKDLDSSFVPAEFFGESAEVEIPIEPGLMGRIRVRKFGAERVLYARAADKSAGFAKGETVRITDMDDECYYVEGD